MLYLFDIDGTLLHCHGAGRRAFERACLPHFGEGGLSDIRFDGKTDPLILSEAFSARLSRAPTAAEAAQIEATYLSHLAEETIPDGSVAVLPHVETILAQLVGQRAEIGLATGNWRAGARLKLLRAGLWDHFPFGGFGCDAAERGELVRIARERGEARLGRRLSREQVLVIGDTPRDIAAAHAADATAVGVATGAYSLEELRAAGADQAYADLGELFAVTRPAA